MKFIDFIRFGKLGELSFGSSEHDVTKLLGTPDDKIISKKRFPALYKYGILQIGFDEVLIGTETNSRVNLFMLDYYYEKHGQVVPSQIKASDWFPCGSTTFREFEDYLCQENAHSRIVQSLTYDEHRTCCCDKGMFTFELQGESWLLHKMSVAESGHDGVK